MRAGYKERARQRARRTIHGSGSPYTGRLDPPEASQKCTFLPSGSSSKKYLLNPNYVPVPAFCIVMENVNTVRGPNYYYSWILMILIVLTKAKHTAHCRNHGLHRLASCPTSTGVSCCNFSGFMSFFQEHISCLRHDPAPCLNNESQPD